MKKLTSVINIVLKTVLEGTRIKEVEQLEKQLIITEAVHEKFVQHATEEYKQTIGTDESLQALVDLKRTHIKKLDELLAIAIDIKLTSNQTKLLKGNIINDIRLKAYTTERRLHQNELDMHLKKLNEQMLRQVIMEATAAFGRMLKD